MKKAIIAKKIGMTQVFTENGALVPVTVLEAGPCVVIQKKTMENDGYEAIQVGFADAKEKKVTKPMKGHFAKQGVSAMKHLKEFRLDDVSAFELGQEIKADMRLAQKSKLMCSQQVTGLTQAAFPKVKVSRVQLRDTMHPEGLWVTVPNLTE